MTAETQQHLPVSVSVAVCCHNGRERLAEVLAHLARQTDVGDIAWDVIVVDNASTDGTAAAARDHWTALGAPAPLRIVTEINLGTQHARLCALRSSRADIVSFVDDDNWVAPDWIARVAELMTERPEVGACGGAVDARFEDTEPDWFAAVADSFAVGAQHHRAGPLPDHVWWLWGAGLSVRRAVIARALDAGWRPRLSCRSGETLASGGDAELCMLVRLAGLKLYFDPKIRLRHSIQPNKCTWDHVVGLARAFGAAGVPVFQYAHAAGLTNGQPGRMLTVPYWPLEVLRAAIALGHMAALRLLRRGAPAELQRLWALKLGRLTALVGSRAEYVAASRDIAALARRLRHV